MVRRLDRPLSRMLFWGIDTVAPKPYVTIDMQAGQEYNSNIQYYFYALDTEAPQARE